MGLLWQSIIVTVPVIALVHAVDRQEIEKVQCRTLDLGRWVDGKCECVNRCMTPPSCTQLNCNGGGERDWRTGSWRIQEQRCKCHTGRTGACCEIITCLHGGKKTTKGECNCTSGYAGRYCEQRKVNCQSGYQRGDENACDCYPGYTGTNCDRLDCKNGGSYRDGTCECTKGYKGKTCRNMICRNGGSEWVRDENRPDETRGCDCVFMFDGKRCESMTANAWVIIMCVATVVIMCGLCGITHRVRQKRAKALYNKPVFLEGSGEATIPATGGAEAVPLKIPAKNYGHPNEEPPSYDEVK